jgi:predicted DNA-binding transcriptional regulator AlpA
MARNLLLTAEAAARLRMPVGTLRYWRHIGHGPPSVKIGRRVMYDADELDAWVERHFAEQH